MSHTAAYQRFLKSLILDFDKWHDGIGYDLAAIAEMTDAERAEAVTCLTDRTITWREIEALAAIDLPEARAAVLAESKHHLSIDNRLAASREMDRKGALGEPIDEVLAREIRKLTEVGPALVRALLMAEDHPTEPVKRALLYASYNRTDAAMHCAGVLCFLCGVTNEAFDWNLRPLFLRLGPHNSYFERKQAFDELCALVKMSLDE